jgi:type I restriction enzyme S subunit
VKWPVVELKTVARIVGGATPSTSDPDLWDGDIFWATPKDLANLPDTYLSKTPRTISAKGLATCSAELLPPNSVLFSSRAPIGHVAINTVPIATNQGFKSMVPGPKLNAKFLYWWLDANRNDLQAMGVGATFKEVSKAIVGRIQIPLPPLDEQKRIAAILDQADALRRLRARALDSLNSLGQAIFHEMFGDPIGDCRSGSGWTSERLDTNIHFIDYRGKTPPKAEAGVRLITAKNVKMGFINVEPQEFIDAEAFDEWMTRGFPRRGDVLFTTEAPLGNVAILDSNDRVAVGQRLITMQPDQTKIDNVYLGHLLTTPGFRKKMFEFSTGSTVVGIKSRLLKEIEIRYPSMDAQRQFSAAISQSERLKRRQGLALVATETLFSSLQHRAFRGDL